MEGRTCSEANIEYTNNILNLRYCQDVSFQYRWVDYERMVDYGRDTFVWCVLIGNLCFISQIRRTCETSSEQCIFDIIRFK